MGIGDPGGVVVPLGIDDDLEIAGGLGRVGPEELDDALVVPDLLVGSAGAETQGGLGAGLEENVEVPESSDERDAGRVSRPAVRRGSEGPEREVLLRRPAGPLRRGEGRRRRRASLRPRGREPQPRGDARGDFDGPHRGNPRRDDARSDVEEDAIEVGVGPVAVLPGDVGREEGGGRPLPLAGNRPSGSSPGLRGG